MKRNVAAGIDSAAPGRQELQHLRSSPSLCMCTGVLPCLLSTDEFFSLLSCLSSIVDSRDCSHPMQALTQARFSITHFQPRPNPPSSLGLPAGLGTDA